MTSKEAFDLEACPKCGFRLMKVPSTGLVSCLASLEFKDCSWHIRVTPQEVKKRKDTMTIKEKKLLELQAEIDRRIQEANEA